MADYSGISGGQVAVLLTLLCGVAEGGGGCAAAQLHSYICTAEKKKMVSIAINHNL